MINEWNINNVRNLYFEIQHTYSSHVSNSRSNSEKVDILSKNMTEQFYVYHR